MASWEVTRELQCKEECRGERGRRRSEKWKREGKGRARQCNAMQGRDTLHDEMKGNVLAVTVICESQMKTSAPMTLGVYD